MIDVVTLQQQAQSRETENVLMCKTLTDMHFFFTKGQFGQIPHWSGDVRIQYIQV